MSLEGRGHQEILLVLKLICLTFFIHKHRSCVTNHKASRSKLLVFLYFSRQARRLRNSWTKLLLLISWFILFWNLFLKSIFEC